MAAAREKRVNAGNRMAKLLEDFTEEESYNTIYGGFTEEAEDQEFGLDALSDEGSDVDIDEEEEGDLEDEVEDQDDEEEGRRRKRRKTVQAFGKRKLAPFTTGQSAKKVKITSSLPGLNIYDDDESTDDEEEFSSATVEDKTEKSEFKTPVTASRRSIRNSTAAKRFETEELEQLRELRRQETGPKTRKAYRIPTQRERLKKSKQTEVANKADLEKYKRDEEENEKKRNKKSKVIRGPFDTCLISTTRTLPTLQETAGTSVQSLVEEAESLIGVQPGGSYPHSVLAFRTFDLYRQSFPADTKLSIPEVKICRVTGKKARYRDPVTQLYYHDSQALKAIHGIIYKHFVSKPVLLGTPKILQFVQWCEAKYNMAKRAAETADIGTYDYTLNEVKAD